MISLKDITNNDLLVSWLLILGFSLASVLGASLVFVDLLFGTGVETTKSWLKYAWPLSGGILLYSTQLSLVPHAYEKLASVPCFSDYPLVYFGAFYFMGILCTHFMSALVNLIAPSAIDTCESHSHAHAHNQSHSHSHSHDDLHHHSHSKSDVELGTQLNSEQNSFDNTRLECAQINVAQPSHYGTITNYSSKSSEYEDSHSSTSKPSSCTCSKTALDQICKNIPYPDYRRMSIISSKSEHEIPLKVQPHVHNHDDSKEELGWKVSIQTAVAIACHKFPEGLLMIIGNSVNQKLGWSLFLGLFVHNFPEGFTLAIPMLMSTGSRMKAFLFAAAIGGLTQPIGGLVGTILVDTINPESFNFYNAIILSSVGGMMMTVVLQCIRSISQSYFEKEAKLKYLLISFFTGLMGMVALNSISNMIF